MRHDKIRNGYVQEKKVITIFFSTCSAKFGHSKVPPLFLLIFNFSAYSVQYINSFFHLSVNSRRLIFNSNFFLMIAYYSSTAVTVVVSFNGCYKMKREKLLSSGLHVALAQSSLFFLFYSPKLLSSSRFLGKATARKVNLMNHLLKTFIMDNPSWH